MTIKLEPKPGKGKKMPITVFLQVIPNPVVGQSYAVQFFANGGTAPYTFSRVSGDPIPNGLTLYSDGTLTGTPAVGSGGAFATVIRATDTNQATGDLEINYDVIE